MGAGTGTDTHACAGAVSTSGLGGDGLMFLAVSGRRHIGQPDRRQDIKSNRNLRNQLMMTIIKRGASLFIKLLIEKTIILIRYTIINAFTFISFILHGIEHLNV